MYGKPITASQWGSENILAGHFDDIDLLARVIIGECSYNHLNDQKLTAIVIVNRSADPDAVCSEEEYPDASLFARVIACPDAYPKTLSDKCTDAMTPARGYHATEAERYVNPGWKNAVELARQITEDVEIITTAYIINGTEVTSRTQSVSSWRNRKYINQQSWGTYVNNYNGGHVSSVVPPLAASTDNYMDENVIFRLG